MKRKSSLWAWALLALFAGITSCSQDSDNDRSGEEGKSGKLTISFTIPAETQTRAMLPSTAKPVTTWANISRAMIIFVDPGTNMVKDARAVTLPTSGSAATTNAYTGVVANAAGYDAYIIGNFPSTWAVGTMKGQNLSTLTFTAPTATDYNGSVHFDTGSTGYGEVEDIFVAKQTNVIVNADDNNTHGTAFALTRINSLFRVRLDANTHASTTKNDKIDFAKPTTMVSIRRAATGYLLTGSTTYPIQPSGTATSPGSYSFANATKALNVFFKADAMKDTNPTAATHSNHTTLLAGEVTFWNEYKIFPGGSNATGAGTGLNKFDIVLSGVTKDGTYIPSGSTTPVSAGTRIYWSGQVQNAVGPNQILELNIMLETAGTTTLPPVGAYGNLEISVSLAQWGDINSSYLPM